MSGTKDRKVSRPKVNFSQSDQQKKEKMKKRKMIEERVEEATGQSTSGGIPKSKNVMTPVVPVTIGSHEEAASASDMVASPSEECKAGSSTEKTDNVASEDVQSTSRAVKDAPKPAKISRCASDLQERDKEKHYVPQLGETLDSIMKNYRSLQQKENAVQSTRKKLQSVPRAATKIGEKSQTSKAEFPGAKYKKVLQSSHLPPHKIIAESRVFPVRKNLRPIVEQQLNYQQTQEWSPHFLNVFQFKEPRCNSIVCMNEKLKKLKDQKMNIVEHLPPLQKSLITGKLSAKLDFDLHEAIYKDLVDLSMDEVPPRAATRTKDPEPRERDIEPELANFFVPEDFCILKDYCEAAKVKLRPPKLDENWNAFKVSSKVLEWRQNLDDSIKITFRQNT